MRFCAGFFVVSCQCRQVIVALSADECAIVEQNWSKVPSIGGDALEHDAGCNASLQYELLKTSDNAAIEQNKRELALSLAATYYLLCSCGEHVAVALGPTAFAAVFEDKRQICRFVEDETNADMQRFYNDHMSHGDVGFDLVCASLGGGDDT